MNRKQVIYDVALSIFSSAIPILLLQLFVLPCIARKISAEDYGLLVTFIALMSVVPSTMGNVLNNIRLLRNDKYQEKCISGDFNLLLVLETLAGVVIIIFACVGYAGGISVSTLLLMVLLSIVWQLEDYYMVGFRLKIDFLGYFKSSIIKCAGFLLGYLLFSKFGSWQWVYICGYAFALIYTLLKTGMWKEPCRRTELFRETCHDNLWLLVSKVLNRAVSYADKLLIYPIMGGAAVSAYYAATVFGKAVSMIITPMNTVVLTYLSKFKKKDDHLFYMTMGIGAVLCFAGYAASVTIGRPVLRLLYPQYANEALKIIYVTSGILVVQTLAAIADPFILKFYNIKWQMLLNGSTILVYVVLGITLLKVYGVIGFCFGVLIANALKLLIMMAIYYKAGKSL